MRFADDFSGRIQAVTENLDGSESQVEAVAIQEWKIDTLTVAWATASGANSVASLLDMVAVVTVLRINVEEYWEPVVFQGRAKEFLDTCRKAEQDVWNIAGSVLNVAQMTELRDAIESWWQANPEPNSMAYAREAGFIQHVSGMSLTPDSGKSGAGSLLGVLMIDPLAGLDPAARELAQGRLFAERALYVGQRMPTLLRLHAELISAKLVGLPEIGQVITNSTDLTASIERVSRVAEMLPDRLSEERREILEALQEQEGELAKLATEFGKTLDSGSEMSDSLNTTLLTVDRILSGLGESEPDPDAEPFRIEDYRATVVELRLASEQLNTLLLNIEGTMGSTNLARLTESAGELVGDVGVKGEALVDRVFLRLMLLAVGVFLLALAYRFISRRMISSSSTETR